MSSEKAEEQDPLDDVKEKAEAPITEESSEPEEEVVTAPEADPIDKEEESIILNEEGEPNFKRGRNL